jgi:hypothetical protein
MQKCPVLSWSKPSLNNSNNEGKADVFSTDDLRRGRPVSHEGEFEVSDNFVENFMIFYERDD